MCAAQSQRFRASGARAWLAGSTPARFSRRDGRTDLFAVALYKASTVGPGTLYNVFILTAEVNVNRVKVLGALSTGRCLSCKDC